MSVSYVVKLYNALGGTKWLAGTSSSPHRPDSGWCRESLARTAAEHYFQTPDANNRVLPFVRAEIIRVTETPKFKQVRNPNQTVGGSL